MAIQKTTLLAFTLLAGCAVEPVPVELRPDTETTAIRKIVRLDEPGPQGIRPAQRNAAEAAMASLAASGATEMLATRTLAGERSVFEVLTSGAAESLRFERIQTPSGLVFRSLGAGVSELNALQAESVAALFDNRDAGELQWVGNVCHDGVRETGLSDEVMRIPLEITWPFRGEWAFVTQATAAQLAPTLARLLGSPVTKTVRDGVARNDGYLRWETSGPLPVPFGVANSAVVILFRGIPYEVWAKAQYDDGLPGWMEAYRNRDILLVKLAHVHGPAGALPGEVEWLTGAVPSHAGLNGRHFDRRTRVADLSEFVDGRWKVFGGNDTLGFPGSGTDTTDAARLAAAADDPAALKVIILDGPATAVRRHGNVENALHNTDNLIGDLIRKLRADGSLEHTAIALGATHGMTSCAGSLSPPSPPQGWSLEDGRLFAVP